MALNTGTRLGPYEILGAIGAGGMGEVYRARDTKLNRDVAIKVLLPAVADNPERLARFAREAQLLAALNHPHIAHIYGLEDSSKTPALVMELVEGPTLQRRLESGGAIPIRESLAIARQIADALAAAHEQGIIHRDLKPANIKVKEDGTVKVLDFGLAKAMDARASIATTDVTASPTITSPAMMTGAGMILGTAAYMAPEQARGKPVDKRADIWAFGCVLFEMLTGARPFVSDEVSDTLALILTKEPEWKALPPATPSAIRHLLRRCLEKDRMRRLADIADARYDLDEAIAAPSDAAPQPAAARQAPMWQRVLPWGVAAVAIVALAALFFLRPASPAQTTHSARVARVSMELGNGNAVVQTTRGLAISPDGTMFVFVATPPGSADAKPQLFARRFDQLQATPFQGTDDASSPFFSPDSKSIAFFAGGRLKKVPADGGAVVVICEAATSRGGWWGADGTITFQVSTSFFDKSRLMKVSAAGGRPEAYGTEQGRLPERWPQTLPDSQTMLATVPSSVAQSSFTDAEIAVQSLTTGARKVVEHGFFARYVPSGHLTYVRDGTLFAAPFDPTRLERTGAAVPIVESVRSDITSGLGLYSISDDGTLVYFRGETAGIVGAPIEWMDRSGKTSTLRATPSIWGTPRFSPDGRQLALTVADNGQNDIWLYDWDRDIASRITTDPASDVSPVWSPDGRWIAYGSQRGTRKSPVYNIYVQRVDGTGSAIRLTDSDIPQLPDSWVGNVIGLHEGLPAVGQDIALLPVERTGDSGWKAGTPTRLRGGNAIFAETILSPDGKWVAYSTNETAGTQVFVQPAAGTGGRVQISSDGGRTPRWSAKRSELVYTSTLTGVLWVVPYSTDGGEFHAGRATPWSDHAVGSPPITTFSGQSDPHPDGERVVMAVNPEMTAAPGQNNVAVVFNFFDELRKKAPAGKN